MFIIFQVWFGSIKRTKRRHVRYVVAYVSSGRLKVRRSTNACRYSITISFALFAEDSFFCMGFLQKHWIYYLVTSTFRFREFYIQAGGKLSGGLEGLSAVCSATWQCTPKLAVIRQASLAVRSFSSGPAQSLKEQRYPARVYANNRFKCV